MQSVFYAFLAIVPWVAFTLLLRYLIAIEGWPAGLVGTFSRVVTLPLLAGWVLATGTGWRRLRPRGVLGWLLVMGAVSIMINLLWITSVKWTTATNVSMLFRLDLVFVVLIGAMLGVERIGVAQLVLLPVMLVGLALLTEIGKFDLAGHLAGDLMIVIAALGFAVNAFVIRHILRAMDEEAVALYNHSMSMLGFIVLAVAGNDFARAREMLTAPAAWLTVVLAGVVAAAGLPLYYAALRRMDIWKLRTFMLSAPVITAAVEWPLWGARLSAAQCLGGAIVLGGLAVLIHVEARAQVRPEVEPSTAGRCGAGKPPDAVETGASNRSDPSYENRKDHIA